MNQEKIGKFICECRKNKKMTQEELAEKLGVTGKSVSRWENGKTMPDYSLVMGLCKLLGITVNELLSGERVNKDNYNMIADENLDSILREYYKMKKQKKIIMNILWIVMILFLVLVFRMLLVLGIFSLSFLTPTDNIYGMENYNKNYYMEKYGGDLDSNLAIFPDDKEKILEAGFESSFKSNLLDTDGYMILRAKYTLDSFDEEIKRLSNLQMIIFDSCYSNALGYTNKVIYRMGEYKYPAYITIDGFKYTYEYALINRDDLEIIYIYFTNINSIKYEEYMKNNKEIYNDISTLDRYSMYTHTFDNGISYMEYSDCENNIN